MGLGTLWVLVFAAMVFDEWHRTGHLTTGQLILGLRNGHRFGALTIPELYAGEVWRTLTSTFVHYGVLHIGMNLWAYYQLGSLVESWYGAGQSIAIYVLTGSGGNLISGLIRHAIESDSRIESGGGSVVVMGLVGLCAVVGWHARTRIGNHLRDQMLMVLVLTAALGIGLTLAGLPVIDNWGHTGGAVMGALIGLGHRQMLRWAHSRWTFVLGWAGVLAMAASALAQTADNQKENASRVEVVQASNRLFAIDRLVKRLDEIRDVYVRAASGRVLARGTIVRERPTPPPTATPSPPSAPRGPVSKNEAEKSPRQEGPILIRVDPEREYFLTLVASLAKWFNSLSNELDTGENSADFQRARQILVQTLMEPPTRAEVREFADRINQIRSRLWIERERTEAVILREMALRPAP